MKGFVTRHLLGAFIAMALIAAPATSHAQLSIGISVNFEPPALPVYVQPPCPQPNYLWMPGYWAWDPVDGYYWVPGTWVLPPQPGYLWTPGYWGWGDGAYYFHPGYWGTEVGFYGGVNYGYGYGGRGFSGGEWRGGNFVYNTAAVNVNTTIIHNTYVNRTIVNNTTIINNNHTSFNGGPNGIAVRPTPQQLAFAKQRHIPPTPAQQKYVQVAKQDRSNFASVNHGVPANAAVPRPVTSVAELRAHAVRAKAAPGIKPYVPHKAAPAAHGARPGEAAHAAGRPGEPARRAEPAHTAARPGEPARRAEPARRSVEPAHRAEPERRPAQAAHHPEPARRPEPRPAGHKEPPEHHPGA